MGGVRGRPVHRVPQAVADPCPENSDQANILLAASDMLHGNLLLHGWYLTDVSFYTTELPQYALLEIIFGVHADTAHIAAAMTYTLAVLLAVLVARGGSPAGPAVIRTGDRGRDHARAAARPGVGAASSV